MDKVAKTKITYEISQIDELVDKSQVLLSLVKNKEPDFLSYDLRLLLTEYMGFRHFSLTSFIKESKKVFLWSGIRFWA